MLWLNWAKLFSGCFSSIFLLSLLKAPVLCWWQLALFANPTTSDNGNIRFSITAQKTYLLLPVAIRGSLDIWRQIQNSFMPPTPFKPKLNKAVAAVKCCCRDEVPHSKRNLTVDCWEIIPQPTTKKSWWIILAIAQQHFLATLVTLPTATTGWQQSWFRKINLPSNDNSNTDQH